MIASYMPINGSQRRHGTPASGRHKVRAATMQIAMRARRRRAICTATFEALTGHLSELIGFDPPPDGRAVVVRFGPDESQVLSKHYILMQKKSFEGYLTARGSRWQSLAQTRHQSGYRPCAAPGRADTRCESTPTMARQAGCRRPPKASPTTAARRIRR